MTDAEQWVIWSSPFGGQPAIGEVSKISPRRIFVKRPYVDKEWRINKDTMLAIGDRATMARLHSQLTNVNAESERRKNAAQTFREREFKRLIARAALSPAGAEGGGA